MIIRIYVTDNNINYKDNDNSNNNTNNDNSNNYIIIILGRLVMIGWIARTKSSWISSNISK